MNRDGRHEAVERILRRNGVSLHKAFMLAYEIVETLPSEGYELVAGRGRAKRSIEPEESFEIKGRGTVYAIKAEPDPLFYVGEHVLMDGAEYEVTGIERFAITPAPGRSCGLLLKPVTRC